MRINKAYGEVRLGWDEDEYPGVTQEQFSEAVMMYRGYLSECEEEGMLDLPGGVYATLESFPTFLAHYVAAEKTNETDERRLGLGLQ